MRKALILVTVLALASFAFAGSFNITTTANQDARIAATRAYWNANNLPGSPYANDTAFVMAACADGFLEREATARKLQADAAARNWQTMNRTQKNAVCNAFSPALGDNCELY